MKRQIERIAKIQQLIDDCNFLLKRLKPTDTDYQRYEYIRHRLTIYLYKNVWQLNAMVPDEVERYEFMLDKPVLLYSESQARKLAAKYPDCEVKIFDAITGEWIMTEVAGDIFNEPIKTK